MNLRNPSMAQNQMLGIPGSFMQTSPPGRQTMPMSGNGANPPLNMHPGAVNPGTMLGQGYPMSNNTMMQGRGPARPPQAGQPMINGNLHMNPSNQLGAGAIGFPNGIPNPTHQIRRAVSQPQNAMSGMPPGVNGNMNMGITTPSSVPPQMRPAGHMQQPSMRPGMHMGHDSAMTMPGSRPVPGPAGVNRPGGTVPIMNSLGPNPMPHQQNNFPNMTMPHSSSPRPGGPNPGMPIGQHPINRARTTPDNSNAFMASFGATFPSGAGPSPGRMPGNNNYPMIPSTSPNQMNDMSQSMGNTPNGTPSRAEFNPTPAQLHSMHSSGAGAGGSVDFPVGPPFAIPQPPSQHNHAVGNPMPPHHPQSQPQSQPQNPSQQQRPRSSQQSHPSTPQQQPQTSHSQPPSHHASPHSDMNNMYPRPQSQPQNQQQQQQGGLGQPSSSGPGPVPGPGSQTQTPRQNPPHPHPHPGPHSHQHPSAGPNIGRIGPPGAQQPPQQGQGQSQQGGPVPNGMNMMGNMGMGSNMGAVGMGPGGMRPPSSSGHPPGQQPIAPRPPSNIFPNVSAPGPGPGPGPHPHSHQQQQQQPHQGGQPGGPSHGPSSSQGQGQGLGPGQGHGPGPGLNPNPNSGMNMNVDTSPPSSSPTDPSQPQSQTQGPQPVQGPAPPGQGPHQGLQGQPGQGQQGQVGAVARSVVGSTTALGYGVGLIRLLQFSGILANENKQKKLQLVWWNDLIREYFTPKAIMRFTLWKDNQRNEAKPFEIGVPILPRFFLVTTQSGVKSMTLTLDGARERLYAPGHAVVECVSAVWTYKYANGYTVALRGPLTVHVVLTAPPPPGTTGANGPSPNGAGMHPQGIGGGNYLLKFEDFQFDAMQHDKYIALESIMGPRSMESPRTPRSRHPIPPGPLGVNGISGDDLVGGAMMSNIGGGMGGGGGVGDDDDRKWEEPRVMIEKGFIPGEPVNAFGIPQATMRCLELAESVAQMSDLIAFSSEKHLGPIGQSL
ncbi:hypothetical protein VKT23_002598 [Stygiomarasmius scandens]|uniref:Uncharacterized protein n=1 Tax=Marasmiellus scandens TaxID=2682957 RepID=A0ABR1K2W5_9AGAR